MTPISRRSALQLLLAAPAAAAFSWTDADARRARWAALAARRAANRKGVSYQAQFFTPEEYEAVRILVDLIIPADERSGSATDAAVPEFIDFMMIDEPDGQTAMRGGLAWLDRECGERFGKTFVACTDGERAALLDDIAWPARARAELAAGVAFFTSLRDLTATGFWSSKIGVEDLQYMGNVAVSEWNGCPPAALEKLGVSYDDGAA